MQVVIDIPEEIYKASQIIDAKYEDVIQIPLEVIKNGIPLSKGHGRLIDADVFEKDLITNEWITSDDGGGLEDILFDALTIIEADKSESEEV